jgi:DNA-binding transcriptional LysR family regulator
MNLTLEALRIVDAIERHGSYAAAAVALDRVPSALSYSMRKLEEDLDVLLFDRRGHRAKLTPAGLELLTEGRHLPRALADPHIASGALIEKLTDRARADTSGKIAWRRGARGKCLEWFLERLDEPEVQRWFFSA